MIKVSSIDTIYDIINKINNCEESEIILDIPIWHAILHNYLSLKIIKNLAWTKKIKIITKDLLSKKIGKSLWIEYSIIKEEVEMATEFKKKNILRNNYTFFEYLIYEIKKYYYKFLSLIKTNKVTKAMKYSDPYEKIKSSGLGLLIVWLWFSIFMFVFIIYFAVNKTYIEIIPEITVKNKSHNIVFEEVIWENTILLDNNTIKLTKVTSEITTEKIFSSKEINYASTSVAKWKAKFVNELNVEQVFKPNTRLLTDDWIVFETEWWVKLPPSRINEDKIIVPGEAIIPIKAKVFDEKWVFIWEKANLKKAIFTIPWLKNNNSKIYAVLEGETKWWSNNYTYLIGKDDIENAKKIFVKDLQNTVYSNLKKQIETDNWVYNTNYEILKFSDFIKYSTPVITVAWWLKTWDKVDKFKLVWSIKMDAYKYNKANVINILKSMISDTLLSWIEKLIYVDEKTFTITDVLEITTNKPLKLKTTSQVSIWVSYNFDNSDNTYIQRLKATVLWLEKSDAKSKLVNEEKIKDVVITNTPFFLRHVTNNLNNIHIKIKQ